MFFAICFVFLRDIFSLRFHYTYTFTISGIVTVTITVNVTIIVNVAVTVTVAFTIAIAVTITITVNVAVTVTVIVGQGGYYAYPPQGAPASTPQQQPYGVAPVLGAQPVAAANPNQHIRFDGQGNPSWGGQPWAGQGAPPR